MNRWWLVILLGAMAVGGYQFWNFQEATETTGEPLVAVSIPAITGAAAAGESAFNENCAACHGRNAAGKDGLGPPLVHKIYEPSHHGDMAFVLAAKQGVRQHHWSFGNMPPQPHVSDQEIQSIIAYIRTLQRANGIR